MTKLMPINNWFGVDFALDVKGKCKTASCLSLLLPRGRSKGGLSGLETVYFYLRTKDKRYYVFSFPLRFLSLFLSTPFPDWQSHPDH